MRARAHLMARELGRGLELAADDQFLELARADHVRALADEERPAVLVERERLHAGDGGAPRLARAARRAPRDGLGDEADMLGRRAAAAADHVDPALVGEARDLARELARGLVVVPVLVGQARVRVADRERARERGERAQVVGHEVGAGGAVHPESEQIEMRDRVGERGDVLAAEHGAHALDRDRQDHRDRAPGAAKRLADAEQRGLDVERVLLGLEQYEVGAALEQAVGRLRVVREHRVERDPAGDRDGLGSRAERAGDEARAVGGRELGRRGARRLAARAADLARLRLQTVLAEHVADRAEGVRLDHVGAGFEVGLVHRADRVGTRQDEVLVAALQLRAAEVGRGQRTGLQHRPHRAVEHEHAAMEELAQLLLVPAIRKRRSSVAHVPRKKKNRAGGAVVTACLAPGRPGAIRRKSSPATRLV